MHQFWPDSFNINPGTEAWQAILCAARQLEAAGFSEQPKRRQ